jgi:proline iminopeptidase
MLDLGNLLGTPWELAGAWPGSELVLVDDAGHDAASHTITEHLVAATDRCKP